MLISVEGAYDIHVHTAPCLFPRLCDDREAVSAAAAAGLGGMMLKCHHESTVSRARALQQEFPDFKVFGGIVLNGYVGGINPAAAEAALRMGAKEVWMPTIDAANHARAHGSRGVYDVQSSGSAQTVEGGVTVLRDGRLSSETFEVLELVAKYDAILGTSHLDHEEIFQVVQAARQAGVKKILITHPYFKVPNLELNKLRELVALGAMAEFGYCTVSPMWAYASIAKIVASVKELGPDNCVIISDAGQRHNPMPHESLRVFAQCLHEKGLSPEDLKVLMIENPKRLLGLA